MKKSLIFFDKEDDQDSLDLLEVVRRMYGSEEHSTYAVCFNGHPSGIEGSFDYFLTVRDDKITNYDVTAMTDCMEDMQKEYGFDCILVPATYFGRMLAPRLAMRLKAGLVADVTGVNTADGEIEMIRPAFSGKLMAAIVNRNCKTIMMSVRPKVFRYDGLPRKETRTIEYRPKSRPKSGIRLIEIIIKDKKKDIRESKILISGGGGVIAGFPHLNQLAEEMGATVSASRRLVDHGIAHRSIQVGQSGKIVSPRLYMALGIYGSVQHMEGLKQIDHIISVNVDKNAPICSLSDIVVEGDAIEFIDRLLEKIRENKNKGDIS